MLPMAFMAPWRSGYAADCKSVYPGSIPGGASNSYVIQYHRLSGLVLHRRLHAKPTGRPYSQQNYKAKPLGSR